MMIWCELTCILHMQQTSRPYREQTRYRVQVEDGLTEPVDIPADCGRTDGLVAWCDIQVAFVHTTTWGQLGVF